MEMDERGLKWPVDWSAVWVGALTALAVARKSAKRVMKGEL